MSKQDLELGLRIRADVRNALGELRAVRDEIKAMGGAIDKDTDKTKNLGDESKKTSGTMSKLYHTAAAAFATLGVIKLVKDLASVNIEMQRLHYTLLAVTGSQQGANEEFQFVHDISSTLGLDLQNTASGYSRLAVSAKAAGISQSELHRSFTGMAEAFTVLHTPAEDVNGLLVQLEQGLSLGKLQMQDFRAIAQHMPGTMDLVDQAVHRMGGSLQDMLQHGGIPAKRFIVEFSQLLHEKYGPEAEAASHSLQASFNRLNTAIFDLKLNLSQGGFIDSLTTIVQELGNIVSATNDLTDKTKGADDSMSGLRTTMRVAAITAHNLFGYLHLLGGGIGRFANVVKNFVDFGEGYTDRVKNAWSLMMQGWRRDSRQFDADQKRFEHNLLRRIKNVDDLAGSNASTASGALGGGGAQQSAQQQKQIEQSIMNLRMQADTYGKTAKEIALYKLQMQGATQAQLKKAAAALDDIQSEKDFAAAVKASEDQVKKENASYHTWLANQKAAAEHIKEELDPTIQLKKQLEQITILKNQGLLTDKEWAAATAKVKTEIDGLNHKMGQTATSATQFAVQAARNMQNAFAQGFFDIMQGKFDNMGQKFKQIIDQMVANLMASKLAGYLFGDPGTTGQIGGFIGGMLHHDGGIVGRPGPMRMLPAYAWAGAPRYHSGGIAGLAPGEVPAILKRGEEVLTRGDPRHIANGGAGGTTVVNFHVTTQDAQSFKRAQGQIGRDMATALDRARRRNG